MTVSLVSYVIYWHAQQNILVHCIAAMRTTCCMWACIPGPFYIAQIMWSCMCLMGIDRLGPLEMILPLQQETTAGARMHASSLRQVQAFQAVQQNQKA